MDKLKRLFVMMTLGGGLLSMSLAQNAQTASSAAPPAPCGPVPSERQLRWHEMEFYAFIHFTVNAFTDKEWGDGKESPQIFNPTELDAKQWARVCKDVGMKGIILTCKHHDGFCLWPSKYTEHSVKNSPWRGGKGDVVMELSDACREAGLKFGVYLSPWDRHEPCYGDTPRYSEHYINQLTELLSNYGEIYEVWWDGACGEGPNGKKQVYDWKAYTEVVRRLQPNAVIFSDAGPDVRWIGNEKGVANETNWSLLRREEFVIGGRNKDQTEGQREGTSWVPGECDVSIRPGWFYHAKEDDKVKSLDQLLDIFHRSIGHNGSFLLNLPPDRRGLIHENDVARLKEYRHALDAIYATNLAKGKPATASNARGSAAGKTAGGAKNAAEPGAAAYAASNVTDGKPETYWATDDGATEASLEIDLGAPAAFDRVVLQEYIQLGQRVESFALDAFTDGAWSEIGKGTTIGHKRIVRLAKPVTSPKLRLRIIKAKACPVISNVELYCAPQQSASAS